MAVKAKDIANQMGISVSTVYKAFNGADDINAETRAAVLETAAEMGYTGGGTAEDFQTGVRIYGAHGSPSCDVLFV